MAALTRTDCGRQLIREDLARKDRSQEIIPSNQKQERGGEQGSRRQSGPDGKEAVTPRYQGNDNRRLKSSRLGWSLVCVQDKGHSETHLKEEGM